VPCGVIEAEQMPVFSEKLADGGHADCQGQAATKDQKTKRKNLQVACVEGL